MKCKKCGAELLDTDKFCNQCGSKVVRKKKCPECGAALREGAKFCPECGKTIGKESSDGDTKIFTKEELAEIPIADFEKNILSETEREMRGGRKASEEDEYRASKQDSARSGSAEQHRKKTASTPENEMPKSRKSPQALEYEEERRRKSSQAREYEE